MQINSINNMKFYNTEWFKIKPYNILIVLAKNLKNIFSETYLYQKTNDYKLASNKDINHLIKLHKLVEKQLNN